MIDKKFTTSLTHEDISTTVYPDGTSDKTYIKVKQLIPEYDTEQNTQVSLKKYLDDLTNRILSEIETANKFNTKILSDLDQNLTKIETYISNTETEFNTKIAAIKNAIDTTLQGDIDTKNKETKAYIDTKIEEVRAVANELLEAKKKDKNINALEAAINLYYNTTVPNNIENMKNKNASNTEDIKTIGGYIEKMNEEITGVKLMELTGLQS